MPVPDANIRVVLMDSATASTLAQVLPILLIALVVELRRTELHHRGRSRRLNAILLGAFFILFGAIETVLVLSIDGELIPFKLSDLAAALIIFGLLALLFFLSLMSTSDGTRHRASRQRGDTSAPPPRSDESSRPDR